MTVDFTPSPRVEALLSRLRAFLEDEVWPHEAAYFAEVRAACPDDDWRRWRVSPRMEAWKARARALGLWNLFLPDAEHGAGLSNVEYAPVAELLGRVTFASEIVNSSAPDTGNMEVLHRYGSPAQQARWLAPLLAGEIRSVFAMTEPEVASSDATNMRATATVRGDRVIVDGHKWWTTGLGHPNAKVAIVMARTEDAGADRHHQHSMVLVPLDAPGVRIERMLPVFGEYDAPAGHGELRFEQVEVSLDDLIAGPGMGFEIAQGRLGPGRIHHAMRCVGAAERALELMIDRAASRTAFGKRLVDLGGNRERIAEARLAIDQARLLTLYAAWKLDALGPLGAMTEISAIKVVAPNVLQRVVDDAIQLFGGLGLSNDAPLVAFHAQARALRLADGPDEVHRGLIAKIELAKRGHGRARGEG
jgi:alkylation response protein AidB-like acyl-CoA dehydrogenase